MRKEKIIEIVWFVVVILLFVWSIKMIRSGDLQGYLISFGIWAPLIIFLLKISTLVVAPLGGSPLYIISGAIFGNTLGFIICFLGDIVGSSICFLLSRKYGLRIIKFFVGSQNTEKILKTVDIITSTKTFIKARIAFLSMPEILSYATGLSRMNFWKFSFINAAFYLPVDLTLVFLGSKIMEIGSQYFLLIPTLVAIFAVGGFFLLYNDYQKIEGM